MKHIILVAIAVFVNFCDNDSNSGSSKEELNGVFCKNEPVVATIEAVTPAYSESEETVANTICGDPSDATSLKTFGTIVKSSDKLYLCLGEYARDTSYETLGLSVNSETLTEIYSSAFTSTVNGIRDANILVIASSASFIRVGCYGTDFFDSSQQYDEYTTKNTFNKGFENQMNSMVGGNGICDSYGPVTRLATLNDFTKVNVKKVEALCDDQNLEYSLDLTKLTDG